MPGWTYADDYEEERFLAYCSDEGITLGEDYDYADEVWEAFRESERDAATEWMNDHRFR